MADILRARIFAIACGYEDANDLDRAAHRPGLQARLRTILCSQPTCSRLENLPELKTAFSSAMCWSTCGC
ncbi:transposase [Mesorhizobium silamurunense]|uniref:transposase n=1 Tax=Mesorhizobium silamurunense TaxID=499528 RepID=UPI001782DFCC